MNKKTSPTPTSTGGPTTGPTITPNSKNKGDTLRVGQFLLEEDYLQNGNHTVKLGGLNGRLVLSTVNTDNSTALGVDLSNAVGVKLLMQPNGNLVILDKNGDACWSALDYSPNLKATANDNNTKAFLHNDGNLILYNNGDPTWTSFRGNFIQG
jgi:hypothetical protein